MTENAIKSASMKPVGNLDVFYDPATKTFSYELDGAPRSIEYLRALGFELQAEPVREGRYSSCVVKFPSKPAQL